MGNETVGNETVRNETTRGGAAAGTVAVGAHIWSCDDLTVGWLTDALRGSGAISAAASVVEVTTEPIGTGQVGHNVRLALTYDVAEPGAPSTLVAKFPSPDETSRNTGIAVGTYDKEARFYAELAPTVDIRLPRCHCVAHDPDQRLSTLLFEDLAPATQGDQLAGCSLDVAAAVVDEMCALHAPRWDDPALDEISWLARPTPESATFVQSLYQSVWPGFVERFEERLSPETRALGERFGHGLLRWAARRAEGPITVVHGDLRLDNLLLGPGPTVTTVDWQTVALGIGTDDLAYFLGAGLLPEVRRAHERELVRRYHEGLLARGVRDYSWERCWDDYRRFSLSGLQMAVVASMIVRADERGDEMFLAMAERHTTQALDLGADRLLGE